MIGPRFHLELAAAGLSGLPIAWNEEGIISDRALLTPEQNTALNVVLMAHDPQRALPIEVTRAQAKIALHRAGLLEEVEAATAQDPEAKIWFTDALTWREDNPYVIQIGTALEADIHALFVIAQGVEA